MQSSVCLLVQFSFLFFHSRFIRVYALEPPLFTTSYLLRSQVRAVYAKVCRIRGSANGSSETGHDASTRQH